MAKKVVLVKTKTLVRFKATRGFTLIEMLVVLVLLSLMMGIAMPKLWNFYQRRTEQVQVDHVLYRIADLRQAAKHQGEPLFINPSDFAPKGQVPLPSDWKLNQMQQLRFLTNGVTNGGEIKLISPSGWQWTIHYRPLDGDVKVTQQHAQ